jgi:flagellar biosynthesis GTPase FlhF
LAFVKRTKNVVLLGPSDVGKTHTALALAHRAVGSKGMHQPRRQGHPNAAQAMMRNSSS